VATLLLGDQDGQDFHQMTTASHQKHADHESVFGLDHSFVCTKQNTQKVFIGEPPKIKQSRGSTEEGPTEANKGPTRSKEGLTKAKRGPTKAREGLTKANKGPTKAREG
jgi:hypothetical protein